MKSAVFEFMRPGSLQEAVSHLAAAQGMARVLGGGQSLVPMLNLRLAGAAQLLDLSGVEEIRQAAVRDGSVVYGAGVTHAQIEDGEVPDAALGLMRKVARGIAYRAVRNRGTLAGSLALCDPSADWVTVMTALDASIELLGTAGERSVRMRDFVLGAYTTVLEEDELIRAVRVPMLPEDASWGFSKQCRKIGEFAQSLAVVLAIPSQEVWRIVVGATEGAPVVLDGAAGLLKRYVRDGWQPDGAAELFDLVSAGLRDAGAAEDAFLTDMHALSVIAAMREAVSK